MGYYTDYEIELGESPVKIEDKKYHINDIKKSIEDISGYTLEPCSKYGWILWNVKWYNCYDDMIEVSKSYPELLFEVYGSGEEDGDIWKKYFHNGKSQHCKAKIEYDEFDINKLE